MPPVHDTQFYDRFRWVYCQLEALRNCIPSSVRVLLKKLPETLDETYERVLRDINKANRVHALHLLQCLTVAARPLRVTELAEVLAIDFGTAANRGTPKLNPAWRWEDAQAAVLSTCSSLITIIEDNGSQIVQFSHFTVKEFLTSQRLASSSADIRDFYIPPEPAHTTFATACLGVLVGLDDLVDRSTVQRNYPLAGYAAEHWVHHAVFEDVSSRIQKNMEYLFDTEKPCFAAWLRVHDMDIKPYGLPLFKFAVTTKSRKAAALLYYAALCGFHDLMKHLIPKHPQLVDVHGGFYVTPLVAALAKENFEVAQLLYQHGANINIRGREGRTPLYAASNWGHVEIVQWLLSRGADPNVQDDRKGRTPLHEAAMRGHVEVARLLVEHRANVNAKTNDGETAYQVAEAYKHHGIVRLLSKHRVK